MSAYQVRVDDDGGHQVYVTSTGRDGRDVGRSWPTPRKAIDYADSLADLAAPLIEISPSAPNDDEPEDRT